MGTPKGKINEHEKKWLDLPWQKVRDSVQVKLYQDAGDIGGHIIKNKTAVRATAGATVCFKPRFASRLMHEI